MIMGICLAAAAQAGVLYSTPPAGWTYMMEGDSDVTADNWYEDNSTWDEQPIGAIGTAPSGPRPGGVSYVVDGDVSYIRIQDAGDPRDHGWPEDGNENRKIAFFHNLSDDGLSDAAGDTLLDDGVTFTFRARLSTAAAGGPLNDAYRGGTPTTWPVLGDGHEIHNEGNGMFVIHQKLPIDGGDDDGLSVAFSLTSIPDPDRTHPVAGLHMNNLDGTAISPAGDVDVDTGNGGGTKNYTTAFDTTAWHEFWITIIADTSGGGTHKVTVYMDGELAGEGQVFDVTAGHGDNSGNKPAFLQMGSTNTNDSMAFDLDFMAYKPGVFAPVPIAPDYNPPPICDAGEDQVIYMDDLPAQLAGTASDFGSTDGTTSLPGIASAYWVQKSGPGTAAFTAASPATGDPIADILNSTVTFDATGDYELLLQVSDDEPKDANDTVVITVKSHADEFLIGHWEMEDNLTDSSVSGNHGEPMADSSPTIGYADGVIGRALHLDNPSTANPNGYVHLGAAPELDIQTVPPEFTASAWIKTTKTNTQVIIQKGGDGAPDEGAGGVRWMLRTAGGQASLITDDDDDKETATGGDIADGLWHFVLATSDRSGIKIYVDGELEGNDDRSGAYDLSGTWQRPGYIGAGTQWDGTEPNHVNGKIFDGVIDDVRVYNYALPLDDPTYDSILSLAADGPLMASVDAGDDFEFNWKPSAMGPDDPLAGVVTDLGAPDAKVIDWASSDPGAGDATFAAPGDPATTVEFPGAGVYTLTLTVFDPDGVIDGEPDSGYVSDDVIVTVLEPTCADVIADDLLLANDFDGDCYIGLSDLVIILLDYLKCNDPLDPLCEWPF